MTNNGSAQPSVMVVDDDHDARELLAHLLEAEGYLTIQAENGRRAQEALVHFMPSLILLDLNMPVMNGREFLEWLRQLTGIQPLVIVITGQIPGVIPGASAIVRKPVEVPFLLRLMRQLLGHPSIIL